MAWAEIRLCRALHVNGTFGGCVIYAVRIGSRGSCVYTTCWITFSSILDINGTAPGVLFLVWCWWVCGVFLRWRFAVGFRAWMMGGASVIIGIVIIGDSSITLCCCSCSSFLTLCSLACVTDGFSILVMFDWRYLMHARPCGVLAAILVLFASSSVNAHRCCIFVRLGSWQCCGYTSVDPDILYARVSGM